MTDQTTELVGLARGGDAAAFAALYEQLAPAVCRFLRPRLGGSQETAEDLTSTVFLKVWENVGRYVDRGLPFEAWVFRIARNCLIDHVRQQPRLAADPLDLAPHVPDAASGGAFARVLDRQVLEDAVARLTDDQRRVVTLRFLEGLNATETGIAMGRSTDAVKKLQARALANLHRLLSPSRRRTARGRRMDLAA